MPPKKLFLIDGSAIAYRSYFAFIQNPLRNSKGENTSAIFGFVRFLFMILDNESPDYLGVIFDPPGPTFRHKQYKEYKATRQKMPDDMRDQVPKIREVLSALNVPVLEFAGYEADDVIGTLAKRAYERDLETYLVSGDKDFMQLVDSHIKMYNPKRAGEDVEILDEQGVTEKVGLPPSKIVDYLGLVGDTSDNVPGVPGVGPKTAVKLIQEFETLENVLDNAEKISRATVRQNLMEHRENALLSKQLVRIDLSVPVDLDLDSLKMQQPDEDAVIQLFRELEFSSLMERFATAGTKPQVDYTILDTREKIQSVIAKLAKAKLLVIDLETTDPNPMRARIVGMALAAEPGRAYYIPIVDRENEDGGRDLFLNGEPDLFGAPAIREFLKPLLENANIPKSGHNIKYDLLVLSRYNIEVKSVAFDTMIASYLINPTLRQHNLDSLALEHLDYVKKSLSDLVGKGKNQMSLADIDVKEVAAYACEDGDITLRLHRILEPMLTKGNLADLFRDVELPLVRVLMEMERTGVSLDLNFLKDMSEEMSGRLDDLVASIYDMAGEEFNINSTQQLGVILFEKLGLPKKRRTKTGYSTDANVLEELAHVHELPRTLLEYRELTKLKSTYVDALPGLINPETGRVHTSYNQTVAATGRLSSSDPNLQNIPVRTEIGKRIRRAFVPAHDSHVILDADYSQIELRVMAHLSQDEVLMAAFKNDEDIHSKTACLVFGVDPSELTSEHRRRAKEINFGIMYGMGVFGLASRLDISREEAALFIDSYFAQYAKVKEFIDKMHAQVEQHGYVTTILNRRRYLPEINSKNRNIREFAKRTAVNTPIQGTAAELIKVAMINIHEKLRESASETRMIMQVHDELVFEVPQQEVDEMRSLIQTEMERAIPLDVPVKVEVGVGPNWLEAK